MSELLNNDYLLLIDISGNMSFRVLWICVKYIWNAFISSLCIWYGPPFQPCFISLFAVVNVDALAHPSDFRIERRQVVFLCCMQDSNPGSQTPNRQYTEDQAKTWTQQPVPFSHSIIVWEEYHVHIWNDVMLRNNMSWRWHKRFSLYQRSCDYTGFTTPIRPSVPSSRMPCPLCSSLPI